MRVKIKTPDVKSGKLEFGKKYGIDIWGASFWFECTFTKKKTLYLICVNSSGEREQSKISKRKLKQMINDKGVTRFIFEVND